LLTDPLSFVIVFSVREFLSQNLLLFFLPLCPKASLIFTQGYLGTWLYLLALVPPVPDSRNFPLTQVRVLASARLLLSFDPPLHSYQWPPASFSDCRYDLPKNRVLISTFPSQLSDWPPAFCSPPTTPLISWQRSFIHFSLFYL